MVIYTLESIVHVLIIILILVQHKWFALLWLMVVMLELEEVDSPCVFQIKKAA